MNDEQTVVSPVSEGLSVLMGYGKERSGPVMEGEEGKLKGEFWNCRGESRRESRREEGGMDLDKIMDG